MLLFFSLKYLQIFCIDGNRSNNFNLNPDKISIFFLVLNLKQKNP